MEMSASSKPLPMIQEVSLCPKGNERDARDECVDGNPIFK